MLVGTVEILKARLYEHHESGDLMFVEPGTYPLHFDTVTREYFWRMCGRLNEPGGFKNLGDGLFVLAPDTPHGEYEEFESPRFSPTGFDEMGVVREEGHPEQRLRIRVTRRVGV